MRLSFKPREQRRKGNGRERETETEKDREMERQKTNKLVSLYSDHLNNYIKCK
jgi:hypothetical protein